MIPVPTPSNPSTELPSRTGPRTLTGIAIFLAAIFWLTIFGQLLFLAPLVMKLMSEYKMKIPWFTERVVDDAGWVVTGVALAALVTCLVLRKSWAWGFALLVLPLLINWTVTLSLFIPTLELLKGLSARMR